MTKTLPFTGNFLDFHHYPLQKNCVNNFQIVVLPWVLHPQQPLCSSSANSATWSKYNSFNFFNGCQKSLSYQILLITSLTADRLFIVLLSTHLLFRLYTKPSFIELQKWSKFKLKSKQSHCILTNLLSTITWIKSSCISFWTHTCLAHNICIIPAESSVSRIMHLAFPPSILDLRYQNRSDQY